MRRFAVFAAVLVALALVYGLAWRTQPRAARPAAVPAGQTEAVTSVTRSCPPTPPGTSASEITMIAMPAQASSGSAGTAAAGSATLSQIPAAPAPTASGGKQTTSSGKQTATGGEKPATGGKQAAKATTAAPVTVSAPGTVTTVAPSGKTAGEGTTVAATGRMAEGFEAEQATSAGLGLVSCTHPSSDMWFVGTGQATGAADVWLYLTNTGSVTASANVTILTDTGQQNGLANAITVAPNQVVAENVTPFVTGSQALALHVQTSTGQVTAAVWEGDNSGGGAWLPQTAEPSTTLVIPGLTVGSSAARLFVTVPGSSVANLKVVALTPSGAVTQFPSTPVEASAGATTPVALSSLASAAALKLTSNVPIVAGVLVPGSGIGAFTTATSPVSGQGVVAGNPATKGVTVGLLLTAPAGAATATITVVGPAGSTASPANGRVVTVARDHTLAVAVPRPPGSKGPFAIVLTPRAGSGPLYAVRVVTSGTGGLSAPVSSLLPMASAPTAITLEPVDNSYTAVLPAGG